MKKLLSLLTIISITTASGASVSACFYLKTFNESSNTNLSTKLINTFLTIDGKDLITNSDDLILQSVEKLNPDLIDYNLRIDDKTLNNALISSNNFTGEVEVTFNALIEEDLHLGELKNDLKVIDKINEIVPNADDFELIVESRKKVDWNYESNSINRTAVVTSSQLAGTVNTNFNVTGVNFPLQTPAAVSASLQIDDETILIAGGTSSNSYLMRVYLDHYEIKTEKLVKNNFAQADIAAMIQLDNGDILVSGGSGANSYLMRVYQDKNNIKTEKLIKNNFAQADIAAMIRLDNGDILVSGGSGANSYLMRVFEDKNNIKTEKLVRNNFAPADIAAMIQLTNGDILVSGGSGANSYLMRVYQDKNNIKTDILITDFTPTLIASITQLHDGTILVGGGSGSDSFLINVDLKEKTIDTRKIVENFTNSNSTIVSITQLDNGTILISKSSLDKEFPTILIII